MKQATEISRRALLQVFAGAGAGLVIGCALMPTRGSSAARQSKSFRPNAYVQIDPAGKVRVTAPRPECGTGVKTSLAMIVAEELAVEWRDVEVVQAIADPDTYGDQGIGGSRSVARSYQGLRAAGAAAVLMLRQAAAARWGLPLAECRAEAGGILAPGGKRARYADLVEDAARLPVPPADSLVFRSPEERKIVGKPTKRVDGRDIVTGKGVFGMDVRRPGMLFACIARPRAIGGRARSFDDAEAKRVPGVQRVLEFGPGVAVLADSTWAAMKGRDALKVDWDDGPNADLDTAELKRRFAAAVSDFPDLPEGAAKRVEVTYELPYLAHATMEPMNCTAEVGADRCEVWVPTQVPDAARAVAARAAGLPESQVVVHLTLVGGGFGRRLGVEYVVEAVSLSKLAARPVQVVWSRDDDMRHDNYRPMTHHVLRGAVDAAGLPIAFFHQCLMAGGRGRGGNWGPASHPYGIEASRMVTRGIESPVPTGAWRSVDATFLGFVNESFFDELAHAGGQDPLELRRKLLRNHRLLGTLELAAEKAKWGSPLPKGWGRGVASYAGFGSFCTQIAEVEVASNGDVRVHRVVAAVDCGQVINPLGVEAQVQGATVDGVATLLHAQITIEKGGVVQENWTDFGWARQSDAPIVEVHTVPSTQNPSGIGEPGYPAVGPAIANAIFAATGKRLRSLPIGTRV